MQTVWVVEQSDAPQSVAMELMGDFAVRRFASLATLMRMKTLDKKNYPDIILVTNTFESESLLLNVSGHYNSTVLFLMPDVPFSDVVKRKFQTLSLPLCPLDFVRMVHKTCPNEPKAANIITHGDLELDIVNQKLTVVSSDEIFNLTRKETKVLWTFFASPGACIDREVLLQQVWDGVRVADRSIDTQVCRIRKIIGNYGLTITSIYGQGYILG
jgi:DNA-binding response OmpR family regulator